MNPRILCLLLLALAGCSTVPPAPQADFDTAIAPLFAADGVTAQQRLQALPATALDARQQATRQCILSRLAGTAPADAAVLPAPVAAVLQAHRRYWTAVLTQRQTAAQAEATLGATLRDLLGDAAGDSLDTQTEAAIRFIEAQGLFALGGVTPPLRELMLWRQQSTHEQRIELPEGTIDVRVNLLQGFVSLGWLGWASCDRHGTGGWATDTGMMVVAPSWDLDSEAYRVSLLAHEAQHFSDYGRYPKLASPDLEYRAKLVELILADTTQRKLLEHFEQRAAPDRSRPHAFANHHVVRELKARLADKPLSQAPPAAIREAARAALADHSGKLKALGATAATSAWPE